MEKPLTKDEKDVKNIVEPIPGANHVNCAICNVAFEDYY
jgi:hypothetical protein